LGQAKALGHPLNVIRGSIAAYNFENEDFLYEQPGYRHMLVVGSAKTVLMTCFL
jgi:hypothetical protein